MGQSVFVKYVESPDGEKVPRGGEVRLHQTVQALSVGNLDGPQTLICVLWCVSRAGSEVD